MDEEQLWDRTSDIARDHPERALALGRRAMARAAPDLPSVPESKLVLLRTTPLEEGFEPWWVLVGTHGAVVSGAGGSQFVGPLGMARGKPAPGGTRCLDRRGAHVLVVSQPRDGEDYARLESRRVPGGGRVGNVPTHTDPEDMWDIHRFDALYLICSVTARPPHTISSPIAGVELIHAPSLGLPGLPGIRGRIGDVEKLGFIQSYRASEVVAQATPSGIVLATDEGMQWTDWALRPTMVRPFKCRSLWLAGGRSGDVALTASIDGAGWLLVFEPDGSERFRVALPGPYTGHVLVEEDGGFFVSPPDWLLAFDRNGKLRWSAPRRGETPAVSLADGHVMFEHNKGLWLADRAGTSREIWAAPGALETTPVYHDGHWWVATADALHELR